MKKNLFFMAGWLLSIPPAMSQNTLLYKVIDPYPDNYNINDKATNIFQIDSFYYLIDGFTDDIPGRSQLILQLDKKGNTLQQTILEGPYDDLAIAEGGGHFITHDGHILFTGEWYNTETGKMGTFLIKMGADLNIIWEQYYSTPIGNGNYYGASVVETDDHLNYLLYASAGRTYLLKTDTSGNLIWSKIIPNTVPNSINGNMIKTQDGNVLITTYVHVDSNPGSKDYTASLAKVDYEGNLLWRKDVDDYTSAGEQQEPMATLLHNGGYAVMWANDSLPWIPFVTQAYFPSLYIMDENGVKEREVRFDRYGIRSVFSLVTAANGDIIGGGFDYNGLGGEDKGWLFRATAGGDMIWQRSFSDSLQRPWTSIYLYDISENTDGSIICVGRIEDSIPGVGINIDRNVNMLLLVTDAEGCLVSGCPEGLQYITPTAEAPRQSRRLPWLEVVPNPVQTTLAVRLPDQMENSSARLQLFNTLGKLVLDQGVEGAGAWQELHVQGLSPGFYSLVLKKKGQAIARQKVLIQP